MKTQHPTKDKNEIYSTSGFKDTLASPIFYPVVVVALVLGITSMLGFVQNPIKLKTMVNVIHQKVAPSNVVSDSFSNNRYNMSAETQTSTTIVPFDSIAAFHIFSNTEDEIIKKMPIDDSLERIAFNYDITSENFWANLDASSLETEEEEMERKQREVTIGAPLEIDHRENYPIELKSKDDSIYALNTLNKI